MPRTYALFYGWLTPDALGEPNDAAHAIAAAGVPLVIAQYWTDRSQPPYHRNLSAPVLSLLHAAGTEVHAYVPTGWGAADSAAARADIDAYLDGGADGIFFDEADAMVSRDQRAYYEALTRPVRDRGRTVTLNAGAARCGEGIMDLCDRVMVEHAWRDFLVRSPWARRYPPERFMGISSNEDGAMGYAIDEARAVADTRAAWHAGVGWHTSTDTYTGLPEWFGRYVQTLGHTA